MRPIKFIDLFAGLGGLRIGFEDSFKGLGFETRCVLTSEIKPYAIKALNDNFLHESLVGDIFKVKNEDIPDFDFLLGGFPCQPFSASGKRLGFLDTRGTLFFEIERILRSKRPYGFILENVEGLVKHDLKNKSDKMGQTLKTILHILGNELGYTIVWKVFDSVDFGLPQSRKRIFIVGMKDQDVEINGHSPEHKVFKSVMQKNLSTLDSEFVKKLLTHYNVKELYGKSIKDKRGGENNIHSWDIELKGSVSKEQHRILNKLFKARRQKKWADDIGIKWMDGMPLTINQISTFHKSKTLKKDLDDLVEKGYLRYEHPKGLIEEITIEGIKHYRDYDRSKPKGYNIVTGKLSFEFNKILNPDDIVPTLVATDMSRLAVPDGKGLRKLSLGEGLSLFGFPKDYKLLVKENEAFDLLGNTIAIPVVKFVSLRIAEAIKSKYQLKSLPVESL